jgi:hypothetical protein
VRSTRRNFLAALGALPFLKAFSTAEAPAAPLEVATLTQSHDTWQEVVTYYDLNGDPVLYRITSTGAERLTY